MKDSTPTNAECNVFSAMKNTVHEHVVQYLCHYLHDGHLRSNSVHSNDSVLLCLSD